MPGKAAPESTFYGLSAAPNAQRLPVPFSQGGAPADASAPVMTAPAADQTPFEVIQDVPTPPAAAPAPVEAVTEAPAPALEPPPRPVVQAPAPEPKPAVTVLKAPKVTGKKVSADIPPAPKQKAAPEPKPAAVETAAASPKPEPDPGVTRLTFGAADAKLGGPAMSKLRAVGKDLLADEKTRLEIRAYAGGGGMSENRARRLSLARALAVRSELIEQGVRSNRIDVRALGDKTENEPFNRVDLTLSSSGG